MTVLLISTRDGTLKQRVELDGRRHLTIGRSDRCELQLAARSVSRRHALMFEHRGRWHIVDTGSRNGLEQGQQAATLHRGHRLLMDTTSWVKVGPAFLWLDPTPVDRHGPPTRLPLNGFDRGLLSAAGLTATLDAAPTPSIAVIDASLGTLRQVCVQPQDTLSVGSDVHCDITLEDPEVHPLHCVLYTEQSRWCVANAAPVLKATRVDGRPTLRRKLPPNRLVQLGRSFLWLQGECEGVRQDHPNGATTGDTLLGETMMGTANGGLHPEDTLSF